MRQALKEDDPDLAVYGCSAHLLNLLGDDVTPNDVIKHVKDIHKYFRNHHKPSAWLREFPDSRKPQLPGDTRWKSQLTCLETYTANRRYYVQICDDHEDDIDTGIARKIRDIQIYRNAKDLIEKLAPIANAIDVCQSDKTSLADATNTWLSLAANPLLQAHSNVIDKRMKQAITVEHLVAYKLHPKYRGTLLTDDQLASVNDYLASRNDSYIATLIAFDAKSNPFPAVYFNDNAISVAPAIWWKGMKSYNVSEGFIDIATHLLTSPASSASIERVFSSFGAVHTKARNRLGNVKAAKLVYCYRMLRGKDELDY